MEEAQELIERAIKLRRDTSDLIGEINSLERLADIYKKREDYPRALEVLETAMEKACQMDSKHAISHISLMLAELAKISGDDAASDATSANQSQACPPRGNSVIWRSTPSELAQPLMKNKDVTKKPWRPIGAIRIKKTN